VLTQVGISVRPHRQNLIRIEITTVRSDAGPTDSRVLFALSKFNFLKLKMCIADDLRDHEQYRQFWILSQNQAPPY
jgi:hypothetical protein